jgi:hypothetical protein
VIFVVLGFVAIAIAISIWIAIIWNPPSSLGAGRLHHSAMSGIPKSRGKPVADPEAEAYALKQAAERRKSHDD